MVSGVSGSVTFETITPSSEMLKRFPLDDKAPAHLRNVGTCRSPPVALTVDLLDEGSMVHEAALCQAFLDIDLSDNQSGLVAVSAPVIILFGVASGVARRRGWPRCRRTRGWRGGSQSL